MYPYNKRNINIAGAITWIAVLVYFLGLWLIQSLLPGYLAFIAVGASAVVFSHDLAMRDATGWKKYKPNYKLFRGAYIFAGIVFILLAIVLILHGSPSSLSYQL
jgi:hypothetical protein